MGGNITLNLESIELIITLCSELTELNLAAGRHSMLCERSIDFVCNNLTTKIEKLELSGQLMFGDNQLFLWPCKHFHT